MKTGSRYKKPAKTNRATRGNVYEAPTFTAKHCNVVGKATAPVLSDTSTLSTLPMGKNRDFSANKQRRQQEEKQTGTLTRQFLCLLEAPLFLCTTF